MSYGETLSRCDTTAFVTALALVADAMRRERARRVTMAEIQARVCARFEVTAKEIQSGSRLRRIARPRQVAMYLTCTMAGKSRCQAGQFFARRDTSTALYACRQVARLRSTDPAFDADVSALERELGA